jgi:hypothetical protein
MDEGSKLSGAVIPKGSWLSEKDKVNLKGEVLKVWRLSQTNLEVEIYLN